MNNEIQIYLPDLHSYYKNVYEGTKNPKTATSKIINAKTNNAMGVMIAIKAKKGIQNPYDVIVEQAEKDIGWINKSQRTI